MASLHDRLLELLQHRKETTETHRRVLKCHPLTGRPLNLDSLPDPFPKGATERQLDKFSVRTGVALPNQLREWLKITNGAAGFYGVSPARRDPEAIWALRPYWKQRLWIPVADDGFGNYYVQLCPQASDFSIQPVCFVEAIGDDDVAYVVASDMLRFALFYLEQETMVPTGPSWPFNKKYMLSKDAQLEKVTDLPMPWDI